MKLIHDPTRRFAHRPLYDASELDFACEDIVAKFLVRRHGQVTFPISTDDLTVLIEQETDDLDSAADLSDLGGDVEGVTDFFRGKKPRVRIAANLWQGASRENRLRTTLAHEFGHVHFHNYLYQVEAGPELFTGLAEGAPLRCKRESILRAPSRDWMEWQAGYVCGSLLMPISHLRRLASAFFQNQVPPVLVASAGGQNVIDAVATEFQVSRDAAGVRLLQLRYLTENELQPLLNLK